MLLTGQDEGDRFVMRIDHLQKCFVTDRLAFETENIAGIATQQHPNTTNEWGRPFFVAISFHPD
jgi:hypothetical protein